MFQAEKDVEVFLAEEHSFEEYCKEVKKFQKLTDEISYSIIKVSIKCLDTFNSTYLCQLYWFMINVWYKQFW